jgi:hypothetical protein
VDDLTLLAIQSDDAGQSLLSAVESGEVLTTGTWYYRLHRAINNPIPSLALPRKQVILIPRSLLPGPAPGSPASVKELAESIEWNISRAASTSPSCTHSVWWPDYVFGGSAVYSLCDPWVPMRHKLTKVVGFVRIKYPSATTRCLGLIRGDDCHVRLGL